MDIAVWGAGKGLELILKSKLLQKHNVKVIVDNDKNKQNKEILVDNNRIKIISPKSLMEYNVDSIVLSVKDKKIQYRIVEQIDSIGFEKKIFIFSSNELKRFPRIVNNYTKECNILYDVSLIVDIGGKTGIQRVVNNIYLNMDNVLPVQWMDGYYTARSYACYTKALEYDNVEYKVDVSCKDKILMVDLTVSNIREKLLYLEDIGAETYVVVYDIIPVMHKEFFRKNSTHGFCMWIMHVLKYADNLMCISRTVAKDIVELYKNSNVIRNKPLKIYTFPMGADLPKKGNDFIREKIKGFINHKTFLMIGTVEPRKNHLMAVNAIEQIIELDQEVKLLIIGKDGWENDGFKDKYYSFNKLHDNILWIYDATDAEVYWAYKHSYALLFPSKVEGYGLPIIEALNMGLPVICSDIPIFREVAGDNVLYFPVDDENKLVSTILEFIKNKHNYSYKNIKLSSWKDSADEIYNIMNKKTEPIKILN